MLLFVSSVLSSLLMIRMSIYLTRAFSIVDNPDDAHKLHDESTPFVGGIGVLITLFVALVVLVNNHSDLFYKCMVLGICSVAIFVTGFVDDAIKLSYKPRFIAQATVAFIMVIAGGVVLNDFGDLLFGLPLQLGFFAIPITVFAVIGGINAINMIDGIDGLSGSVSLVSLMLIGVVAFVAGDQVNLMLITALVGGVLGFLYFNLRYHSQRYARVFLGDNGSMLLGLMFAWLLVELSQGPNPAMTPVTAIWLFSVPLMDIISVMLRRMWLGKSPFTPDRNHLHHLLQKAGFRVPEIVFLITLLHAFLGIIGLMGMYLGVYESLMFVSFLLVFLAYFYLTLRPWRFVPLLRHLHIILNTRLAFAPTANHGTFFSGYSAKDTENLAKKVSRELGVDMNFGIRVFVHSLESHATEKHYAHMLNIWPPEKECVSDVKLKQYVASLKRRLKIHQGIQLRQFVGRKSDGDAKVYKNGIAFGESKTYKQNRLSRRKLGPQALVFEVSL